MENNGPKTIEIPQKEGYLATVLTWRDGITSYIHNCGWTPEDCKLCTDGPWDLISVVGKVVVSMENDTMLALPNSERPDWIIWIPAQALRDQLRHIHQQVSKSPFAVPSMAGRSILVPQFQHGKKQRH